MADQRVNQQKRKKKINFYKFVGKVEDTKGVVNVGNDKVVESVNNLGKSVNGIAREFEAYKSLAATNFLKQQKMTEDAKKRKKLQPDKKKKSNLFGGAVLGGLASLVAAGAGGILDLLGGLFKFFVVVPLMKWMSKEENREKLANIISGIIAVGKFLFNVTKGIVFTTLDLIAGFTKMPFWKEILNFGLFAISLGVSFLAFKKLFGGKAVKFVVKGIFKLFKGFFKSMLWFSKKLARMVARRGLGGLRGLFKGSRGKALAFTAASVGTSMVLANAVGDGVSGKDLEEAEQDLTTQEEQDESEIDALIAQLQGDIDKVSTALDRSVENPTEDVKAEAEGVSGPSAKPESVGGVQEANQKTGPTTGEDGLPKEGDVEPPKQGLDAVKERAGQGINFVKTGFSNILNGKSFFDQEGDSAGPAEESKASGGRLKSFAGGGWIQGPQTGYPVSLDGGKSTAFIGHGTEYVATKAEGGGVGPAFVIPFDTPATRGNPNLTERRTKEAKSSGFLGYSEGGEVNQQQDMFGGDARARGAEPNMGGGEGPVSGQPLFNPDVIKKLLPKGYSTGGNTDDGGDNGPNSEAPDVQPKDGGVGQGKAILEGAKKIIGLKKGVGDMCAFTTRAALAAAGHNFAEKRTQKGDLDTPKGTGYNGRNYAASFGGSDMGTIKTSRSQVTAGDVILWRDYAGGRYGKGAITHVGIAATDGLTHQYDHNRRSGWHYRPHWDKYGGTEWFAGVTLGGKASGAVPGDSNGDVKIGPDGKPITNQDANAAAEPDPAAMVTSLRDMIFKFLGKEPPGESISPPGEEKADKEISAAFNTDMPSILKPEEQAKIVERSKDIKIDYNSSPAISFADTLKMSSPLTDMPKIEFKTDMSSMFSDSSAYTSLATDTSTEKGYAAGGTIAVSKNYDKRLKHLKDRIEGALSMPMPPIGYMDPATNSIMTKNDLKQLKAKYDRMLSLKKIRVRSRTPEPAPAPAARDADGTALAWGADTGPKLAPMPTTKPATPAAQPAPSGFIGFGDTSTPTPATMMAQFQKQQSAITQPPAESAQVKEPPTQPAQAQTIQPVTPKPGTKSVGGLSALKDKMKDMLAAKKKEGAAKVSAATAQQNKAAQAQAQSMSKPLQPQQVKVPVPKGGGSKRTDDVFDYRPGFGLFSGGIY